MALAQVFEAIAGPDAPVEFKAYDGSSAGIPGSPVKITVRSPIAVSYLAQAPGALGLARAYVSGHLDVDGDMFTALSRLSKAQDSTSAGVTASGCCRSSAARRCCCRGSRRPRRRCGSAAVGSPSAGCTPRSRDANSISHHYDVSNTFYEWVLGPTMAYTCACYPTEDATLEEAQEYKFDLVARKVGLKPGMRLLDVGCGWGGMVMHAAREYGVKAIGVTLSAEQAAWAQEAIKKAGP